jgi:hypothetical protein
MFSLIHSSLSKCHCQQTYQVKVGGSVIPLLQSRDLKFRGIKRFAKGQLSRHASSQLLSTGMHSLFHDGQSYFFMRKWYINEWCEIGRFWWFWDMALGYDWLELTLPGSPVVCISRAFHVANTSYLCGFWLYHCIKLFIFIQYN